MAKATDETAIATTDPTKRIPVTMRIGRAFCRKLRSIPPVVLPVVPPVPLLPPPFTVSVTWVEPLFPAPSWTSTWMLNVPVTVGVQVNDPDGFELVIGLV